MNIELVWTHVIQWDACHDRQHTPVLSLPLQGLENLKVPDDLSGRHFAGFSSHGITMIRPAFSIWSVNHSHSVVVWIELKLLELNFSKYLK